MRAGLAAARFDIASLHRTGQVEVELGATARLGDRDLADVRVPRKLGEQSKPDRERGVPERRWPGIAAADAGRLVGVHDVGAVVAALERIV